MYGDDNDNCSGVNFIGEKMREYMITLGSVMMMVSISGILMPEGGIKKFASLAMGFMVITVAVFPLGGDGEFFKFTPENFGVDEKVLIEAESLYEQKVLAQHRENLEKMIAAHMKHGSRAEVSVREDGKIDSVTLYLKGDESAGVNYIVNTLNLPRERIKLVYENN